jgi:hypothetical protein
MFRFMNLEGSVLHFSYYKRHSCIECSPAQIRLIDVSVKYSMEGNIAV